jgi:hypothetical protein
LPDDLSAAVRVMPGAWYQRQLDAMRGHVRRKGKAGWRADWQGYWIAWLRRALDAAGRADASQLAPCTAGEVLSGGLSDGLDHYRRTLVELVGASHYRAWLKDCHLTATPEGVVIAARSAFVLAHVRENFSRAAGIAATRCGFEGASFVLGAGGAPMVHASPAGASVAG